MRLDSFKTNFEIDVVKKVTLLEFCCVVQNVHYGNINLVAQN
jgi:hypothetical protein